MAKVMTGQGSCICGAVQIKVSAMSQNMGACHCGTCQKWGGGPFMTVDCGSDVTFEGSEQISKYNSSDWAERGFCGHCGSHLFYRLKQNNQYFMPAGLFNEMKDLVFNHQVFIDEKPAAYNFVEETENMTGAELFAKYAPPSD